MVKLLITDTHTQSTVENFTVTSESPFDKIWEKSRPLTYIYIYTIYGKNTPETLGTVKPYILKAINHANG